jgi:hypothetical protein
LDPGHDTLRKYTIHLIKTKDRRRALVRSVTVLSASIDADVVFVKKLATVTACSLLLNILPFV